MPYHKSVRWSCFVLFVMACCHSAKVYKFIGTTTLKVILRPML